MRTHISIVTNNSSYSSTITQTSNFSIFRNIILFILLVLIVFTTIYLLYYLYELLSVKVRTVRITESKVTATVFDKEYHSPSLYGFLVGRVFVPRWTSERYLLGVEYNSSQYHVEVDEDTYEKARKGDNIDLIWFRHYDKKGKVIQEEMELPEWIKPDSCQLRLSGRSFYVYKLYINYLTRNNFWYIITL